MALIVTLPGATPVTTPVVLTVAMLRFRLAQMVVASPVKSLVEVSEYVPVSVNGSVRPSVTLADDAVIFIDAREGEVTVKMVLPVLTPYVAEIVVVPGVLAVAKPVLVTMVATAVLLLDQFALVVLSIVEPSVQYSVE